jgi:hypothetical protein
VLNSEQEKIYLAFLTDPVYTTNISIIILAGIFWKGEPQLTVIWKGL